MSKEAGKGSRTNAVGRVQDQAESISRDAAIRVAVIGKSKDSVATLERVIGAAGFHVVALGPTRSASDPEAGLTPQMIVVDVDAVGDGRDLGDRLEAYRSNWHVPVVCLLPIDETSHAKIVANLNAEEYLFKPVRPDELVCRMSIVYQRLVSRSGMPLIDRRRHSRRRSDRHVVANVRVTGFRIDEAAKVVRLGGRLLKLTPREYKLLRLLVARAGEVVSTDDILDHVWKSAPRASAADVHQLIYALRKKVETDPSDPRWILTVKGFGYQFQVPDQV
jgi:DNA-binding response OmpR family regulator